MDPSKAKVWQRLSDRVRNRPDWPQALWLAAVEDALKIAVPPNSGLLADYRRKAAELLRLEKSGDGSAMSRERIAQLETEIEEVIGAADQKCAPRPVAPAAAPRDIPPITAQEAALAPRRAEWARTLVMFGFGLMLVGGGWFAAINYYDERIADEVAVKLQPFAQQLGRAVSDVEAGMAARIGEAEEANRQLLALKDDLLAEGEQLRAEVARSRLDLATMQENAAQDLERQLGDETSELVTTINGLHREATSLGRRLDQVGTEAAKLEQRLPPLGAGLEQFTDAVEQVEAMFEHTSGEIAALQSEVPRMAQWITRQRQGLQRELSSREAELGDLDTRISDLRGAVNQSRKWIGNRPSPHDQARPLPRLDNGITGYRNQASIDLDTSNSTATTNTVESSEPLTLSFAGG